MGLKRIYTDQRLAALEAVYGEGAWEIAKALQSRQKVSKRESPRPFEGKGRLVKVAIEQGPVVATRAKQGAVRAHAKAEPELKRLKSQAEDRFTFRADGKVSKADNEKRQVYGWVSVTEVDGEPVVDRQGDYVHIDVIEKAAHDYMANSRKGGDMHVRIGDEPKHVSDLIESFVVTDEKKKILGLPESTPTGWWAGFQIHDDATWELVKKGERPMFSIHGSGRRVEKTL